MKPSEKETFLEDVLRYEQRLSKEKSDKVDQLETQNTALLEALQTLDRAHKKGFINLKNFHNVPTKAIRKAKGEMMSEKTMIAGAKKWADRCETHARGEVHNGVVYVHYLLYKLARLEAENKALRKYTTHREDYFQAKSVFRIIHCSCGLDALLKGDVDD